METTFPFLEYLAPEGLTPAQATDAIYMIEAYERELRSATRIESVVELSRTIRHNDDVSQEIERRCMSTADFNSLLGNTERLATVVTLKKWLVEAQDYYTKVTAPVRYASEMMPLNIYAAYTQIRNCLNPELWELIKPYIPALPTKVAEVEPMTKEEHFARMTAQEKVRYYRAEAAASTVGKYVHPAGSYAAARNNLFYYKLRPTEREGSNLSGIFIVDYTPSVSVEDVDRVYFELQQEQRDWQKELNGMRYAADKAVRAGEIEALKRNKEIDAANRRAFDEYVDSVNAILDAVNDAAKGMRIAIPDEARQLLDEIMA